MAPPGKSEPPPKEISGGSANDLAGELVENKDSDAAPLEQGETAFDHGAPGVVAIYNGRDFLGSVAVGRSIRAIRPDGSEIGKFETREAARRAVVRDAFGMAAP